MMDHLHWRVGRHFVAWQVRQKQFEKYCESQFPDAKIDNVNIKANLLPGVQNVTNEDIISVTLEWSCRAGVLSSAVDVPFKSDLWVTRPLVWLFHISGMTSENSLCFAGGASLSNGEIFSWFSLCSQLWLMSNHFFQSSLSNLRLTDTVFSSTPALSLREFSSLPHLHLSSNLCFTRGFRCRFSLFLSLSNVPAKIVQFLLHLSYRGASQAFISAEGIWLVWL